MPELNLDPRKLMTPEIHAEIYGVEEADDALVAAIKEYGVVQPLVVARFEKRGPYLIVSGCRRRDAAIKLGLKRVPCVLAVGLKLAHFDRLVVEYNRYRKKTNTQLANEFQLVKEKFSHLPAEKRRAEAAKAVGIGINKAEKAAKVVEEIEQLRNEGEQAEAEKLAEVLNEDVDAAHESITPPPVPASLAGVWQTRELLKTAVLALRRAASYLNKAKGLPGAELLNCPELVWPLNDAVETVKAGMPHAACPLCQGTGCKLCQKRGWLTKEAVKRRS